MSATAYPLQWPVGWNRTPAHRRRDSAYKVDFRTARDQLARELRLLDALPGTTVLSTNVPTTIDGLPYAQHRQPDDPGCACYWSVKRVGEIQNRVIACDAWRTVRENTRAIGLTIEALRMLERTGASEILDRAFSGFAAFPPASNLTLVVPWCVVLDFEPGLPYTREAIEQRFRELAKKRHPDGGGTAEAFRELVAAKEAALKAAGP